MLSDNIRIYRKKLNLSQEELAAKVGVSRQSVSFWETGQTQPTIDNIIALSKIFNISSDTLLGNCDSAVPVHDTVSETKPEKNRKIFLLLAIGVVLVIIIAIIITVILSRVDSIEEAPPTDITKNITASDTDDSDSAPDGSATSAPTDPQTEPLTDPIVEEPTEDPTEAPFDLFEYCKSFAIEKGKLNGDYCMYQQPSANYGGYDNEYFSISYWSDSDVVEFSLHCPLSETQSHNFYLKMRGGYNGKYEYVSSKYYRDTGESFRFACGYIDPFIFSDSYPIPCDEYIGDTAGQDTFMEDSRVGICDLIYCLKNFVTVENMECDFSDFDFVNF